jgi:hypothetical protein
MHSCTCFMSLCCFLQNREISRYLGEIIYTGEHKRTLHIQNDTENKCGVLKTSHLHHLILKLSKFCTHLTETWYVLRKSHSRCRDDNPQSTVASDTEGQSGLLFLQMLEFLVQGVNGHSWVVPCEIVCKMHVAQLLQTLSSLTAEHTNSCVVR